MYLIASPTELEVNLLRHKLSPTGGFDLLVTGVGPVESAISLTRLLEKKRVDGVIIFGIGGAYTEKGVDVLDICLAEEEHFGDLGIAMNDEINYFSDKMLTSKQDFDLRNSLSNQMKTNLMALRIPFKSGPFVTVQACSGTFKRGNFLRDKFNAICENMEGAAIARVCDLYNLPLAELRCISNRVEDRDMSRWKFKDAVTKGTELLGRLLSESLP